MSNFTLAGSGYKPTPNPMQTNWTPTPTFSTPSSPLSGSVTGQIGHGGATYNANAQYTHNMPNGSLYGGIGRSGSTFNNKGTNNFSVGGRFNF